MPFLPRRRRIDAVRAALRKYPVVALLGPRQCGKTTLARDLAAQSRDAVVFDLEDERDVARLADPLMALQKRRGIVVLDEVQRRPGLFPSLRVLADRRPLPSRFLVLGSASRDLLHQASESLAGRIKYLELDGFALDEIGEKQLETLWVRGGFPRSMLAKSEADSFDWRREFIKSFVERDLPQLGATVSASTIRRFWAMLAHYHGQIWNASEFARAFGVSESTVRRYVDLLVETFVVRRLAPWSENISKRQVKSPKLYIADSGLLHALLGIRTQGELEERPTIGASWEGFGISQVIERLGASRDECHFWATQSGAELDLLVVRGAERRGFEFKRTVAPRSTRSMHIARQDLGLKSLDVVHAGEETFDLAVGIRALALARILKDLKPLG